MPTASAFRPQTPHATCQPAGITRRQALHGFAVSVLAPWSTRQQPLPAAGFVNTVTGPVPAAGLGLTLSHEHLFSRFGDPPAEPGVYQEQRVLDTVGPYLAYLRALGVETIVDATAAWFGRAPRLLRALSQASGVQIITNTGYYGAADDRYVPPDALTASPDELVARWTREFSSGIGDSGIRPGFIKIGVDGGPLSRVDRTLVVAAARTHLRTGMTIACHTGDNPAAAREQLDVMRDEQVAASAWVWVHASACQDDAALWRAATSGAWLGFDGLNAQTYDRHLALVKEARARELLGRVLLSHDGNSFPAPGRLPRPYDLLMTTFRYRLLDDGLSEDEVDGLLRRNPREAWAGGARRR